VFDIHLIFKRLDFCVGAGEVPTTLMIGGRFPMFFSTEELAARAPVVFSHEESSLQCMTRSEYSGCFATYSRTVEQTISTLRLCSRAQSRAFSAREDARPM
jgi:hypothetical protein